MLVAGRVKTRDQYMSNVGVELTQAGCDVGNESTDPGLAAAQEAAKARRQELRQALSTLRQWYQDPHALAGEGLDAPSLATIAKAMDKARRVLDGLSSVTPNALPYRLRGVSVGSGGSITFESEAKGREGVYVELYTIHADNTFEWLHFRGTELLRREVGPLG